MEQKLEKILLDLNIGYISVRVAKTKILKLIENEKQKPKHKAKCCFNSF